MARIRIDLPERFIFKTKLNVRVTDLNYGDHLGNHALLGLIHEARLTFLRSMGCKNEKNVFGKSLIMADSGIVYKAESFLADELIFEIAVMDISRSSFDIIYRITRENDGVTIAIAKTGMVFFNYETGKIDSLPEAFRIAVESA